MSNVTAPAPLFQAVEDFDFMAVLNDALAEADWRTNTPEGRAAEAAEQAQYAAEKAAEVEAAEVEASRYAVCGRCGGRGRIEAYRFNASGTCFGCDGEGRVLKRLK